MIGKSIIKTILTLFNCCILLQLPGQSLDWVPPILNQAELHIQAFRNDQAEETLTPLIDTLQQIGLLETAVGLKVQERLAHAQLQSKKREAGTQLALQVIDQASAKGYWEVVAHAHLTLALMYELSDFPKLCKAQLEAVRALLNKHQLPSIYPNFCIRIASYYRVIERLPDSVYHYANEAAKTSPTAGTPLDEAISQLLLGLVHSSGPYQDIDQAIFHYTIAAQKYDKCQDYMGMLYCMNNIATHYLRLGKTKNAKAYADSIMQFMALQKEKGSGHQSFFASALKTISLAYEQEGKLDSALAYQRKSSAAFIERIKLDQASAVREVEAKFNEEKRIKEIATQKKEIQYQKLRSNLLGGLVALFLIIAGSSSYFYLRLRKANKRTKHQAQEINQKNQDLSNALNKQLMLQGELHHRVKNNLQIIISLLELQMEDLESDQAKLNLQAMANRIHSMAAIHRYLYQSEDSDLVSLSEYTQDLCDHLSQLAPANQRPTIELDFHDYAFNLDTLISLGLILTELITNSLKYALQPNKPLLIQMSLEQHSDTYLLTYQDNGLGFPKAKIQSSGSGMGTYLLKSMSRQLGGRVEQFNANGAITKVYFKERNVS